MDSFFLDLRHGFRTLARRPGFTAVASLTLALGIGANTAIFSVVNAVLLRPLPFPDPDRLVAVWETFPEGGPSRVAPANYFDWSAEKRAFEAMAAFGAAGFSLTGQGEPEQLLGAHVSASYFSVLGIRPLLGRFFTAEEDQPGAGVVVLSQGLWRRRFGASREVIGQKVTLDGAPFTVLGIMPPGIYPTWPRTSAHFSFRPEHQQFWIPLRYNEAGNRRSHVRRRCQSASGRSPNKVQRVVIKDGAQADPGRTANGFADACAVGLQAMRVIQENDALLDHSPSWRSISTKPDPLDARQDHLSRNDPLGGAMDRAGDREGLPPPPSTTACAPVLLLNQLRSDLILYGHSQPAIRHRELAPGHESHKEQWQQAAETHWIHWVIEG